MRLSASSDARTYFLQYRVKGTRKQRQITIGRHNDPYRMEQARAKAIKLKGELLEGTDPVEDDAERKEDQARQEANQASRAATLRQVMEHYLIHRRTKHGPLRDRTKEDIRRHCEVNLARWLDRSIAETVSRSACLERFTAMSEEAAALANLCMKYRRSLCNHARDMFATEGGEYLIFAANPVTQMLKLRKLNPTKARKGRVPKDRIGHVWLFLRKEAVEARRDTERTAADWLSCILLSGARKMESGSLERTDIDLVERTLQLRGDVTKNHNDWMTRMCR